MSDVAQHDGSTAPAPQEGDRIYEGLVIELRFVPSDVPPASGSGRMPLARFHAALFVHDAWMGAANRRSRGWLFADTARERVDDDVERGVPAFCASDPRYLLPVFAQEMRAVYAGLPGGGATPTCIVYTEPDEWDALLSALAPASVHLRVTVVQGNPDGAWRVSEHDPVTGAEREMVRLVPLLAHRVTGEERHELLESYEDWRSAAWEQARADQIEAAYADQRAALVDAWQGEAWAEALRARYASETFAP